MRTNKSTRYGRLERRYFPWVYLFLLPTFVVFLIFYAEPIFVMLTTSFTKWDGFNDPQPNGIANYLRLITNSTASISVKNLIYWALIAMTIHVAYGVIMAFIWYYKPAGWKLSRAVFMIPNVISPAAFALIFRFLMNDSVGAVNVLIRSLFPEFKVQWFFESPYAFWAVTFIWLFYSVVVSLIVYNDLVAIPTSLTEAAELDGASGWKTIRYIYLPLCHNSIGTSIICSITSRIAMYEAIALTTSGGPGSDTMSLSVLMMRAISDYNYGFANAIGVVLFVFGIIVLVVVNKLFRMGESDY